MGRGDDTEDEHAALRDAVLAFDATRLEELSASGRCSEPRRRFAAAWAAIVAGDAAGAAAEAEALEARGRRDGDAALVIECAALRALAEATGGDLAEATALARRASRMGRTEAIFEPECLAHLVLARIRRLTGYPHLATRILRSLWARTPSRFYGWLSWELWMAGAREEGFLLPGSRLPFHRAAAALYALLDAADEGSAAGYREAAAALEAAAAELPLFTDEVRALLDANDRARAPQARDVADWCAGRAHDAPAALHGVLTREGAAPADESAIAYVHAAPGARARRITRLGWALVESSGVHALPQSRRKQGRNETIAAALALAGPEGLHEATLFEMAYEFRYIPETHGSSFGVAMHRARKYVGDAGVIHHEAARVWLELRAPVLIPDPRCKKPLQDRLLCAIADQRGASPRDIAQAVGVSLRIAQATLASLSADGSCVARKQGRELVYEVEDTTFSEPTRLRNVGPEP